MQVVVLHGEGTHEAVVRDTGDVVIARSFGFMTDEAAARCAVALAEVVLRLKQQKVFDSKRLAIEERGVTETISELKAHAKKMLEWLGPPRTGGA